MKQGSWMTGGMAVVVLCVLGGCTAVQPWERGDLARPEMQWQTDPAAARLKNHVHYSKEAASGDAGAAGGGCGCN